MKRIAASFTFFGDIITAYGYVIKEEPFTVSFPPSSVIFPSVPESVVLSPIGSSGERFYAEILNMESGTAVFKKLGPAPAVVEDTGFSVGYKNEFTVASVMEENIALYSSYVSEINAAAKSRLASRLKEMLKREESENYEIFSFLFEINSKLDEILSVLKPPFPIEGGFTVRGVSIWGGGVSFFTDAPISEVKTVFLRALLSETADRFYFASLADLYPIKMNPDGSGIYGARFIGLDENIKDAVMRFIFAREREILKEARS